MRAYTVSSLAAEWHCSEGTIRKLIGDGELGCFRLGTLIRIPAEEVARFESSRLPSSASEEDMLSSGEKRTAGGEGSASMRPTAPRQKRRRVPGGNVIPALPRQWAGS
jgi:excisionase family DNA binding protein